MSSLSSSYEQKDQRYFSGVRKDLIDRLEVDPNRAILEIGCGDGSTGAYAKQQLKCGLYVGVELMSDAAKLAKASIDRVYNANIETFDIPEPYKSFDVLIAGEVLEHLIDPWGALKRLRQFLRPGGLAMASSPNVAHHSTIKMLLKGEWTLADSGRMDRTHLRWFTPKSYAEMFWASGFEVISTEPLSEFGRRAKLVNMLTGRRLEHLFIGQIVVVARNATSSKSEGTLAT
jgi:2-polyprenyl-3-methyl-5-hydroxy-6-metoxy-1,4-benzoquinol methylase